MPGFRFEQIGRQKGPFGPSLDTDKGGKTNRDPGNGRDYQKAAFNAFGTADQSHAKDCDQADETQTEMVELALRR